MSDFHQAALCFLIRILSYDPKYKDVFREVGVLEVLTNCLKQYADALKEKYDGTSVHSVYSDVKKSIYLSGKLLIFQTRYGKQDMADKICQMASHNAGGSVT